METTTETTTTTEEPARPGVPVFDHFAWDDDGHLVCTDDDTLASVRRTALSPSTSNGLDPKSCPARWAVEKVLRIDDPMSAAGKGTGAHRILELFFQLPPAARTKTQIAELGALATKEQWADDADSNLARLWRRDVEKMAVGIFAVCDPPEVTVVSTEATITDIEVGGVPFNGTIDLVERTADGIRLIDFKSGKVQNTFFGDTHGDQLRLYAAAWKAAHGDTVTEAAVYYIAHGKVHDVDLSRIKMARTLRGYKRAWARHNQITDTALFPTKSSPLCGWCPIVDQCPTAARNDKVARVALPDPVLIATARRLKDVSGTGKNGHNIENESTTDHEGATTMPAPKDASTILSKRDGKSWVTENEDGRLNAASYTFNKMVELTTFANFVLQDYRQPNNAANRQRFARLMQYIAVETVYDAHPDYAEDDFGSGVLKHAATIARYVVRQMRTRTSPIHPPFGKGVEEWEAWADKVITRSASVLVGAARLYDDGTPSGVGDAFGFDGDDDVFGEDISPWIDTDPVGGSNQ